MTTCAALDWSHTEPAGAAAELRLAAALAEFWDWRGHHSEGRTRLAAAVARDDSSLPATRALALDWAGRLATFAGEFEQAEALLQESLVLARAVGEPRSIARVLRHLSNIPERIARLDEAEALVTEALDYARQAGEPHKLSILHCSVGWVRALRGDLAGAQTVMEDGLVISEAAGDRMVSSTLLALLAGLALEGGDAARARRLAEASLARAREITFRSNIISALGALGDAARLQGDVVTAWTAYRDSLILARDQGNRVAMVRAIIRLVGLCVERQDHQRAARLFAAVERWRPGASAGMADWHPAFLYRQDVAATRRALGEVSFAAIWEAGQAVSLEEAMTDALALAAPAAPAPPAMEAVSPLTAREQEVAGLIVQGLTNRQIAARLSISPNTVERYVEHILNKLGLSSRARVAAWAVERGLGGTSER